MEAFRWAAITKRDITIFTSFRSPRCSRFSPHPALLLYKAAGLSRWKTLVWQPSKSRATQKVTCVSGAVCSPHFYIQYWGDDQKKWEPWEKLKDVYFGLNNNTNPPGQARLAFRDRTSVHPKKKEKKSVLGRLQPTSHTQGFLCLSKMQSRSVVFKIWSAFSRQMNCSFTVSTPCSGPHSHWNIKALKKESSISEHIWAIWRRSARWLNINTRCGAWEECRWSLTTIIIFMIVSSSSQHTTCPAMTPTAFKHLNSVAKLQQPLNAAITIVNNIVNLLHSHAAPLEERSSSEHCVS